MLILLLLVSPCRVTASTRNAGAAGAPYERKHMFNQLIDTKYGKAWLVAKTSDGGYLVSLPKKNMTQTHPNFHGGPCVCFIYYGAQA